MEDALIGSTGFVGRNLLKQHEFAGSFHSRNAEEAKGSRYDVVVCAAAPATMWAANNNPESDLENIQSLLHTLQRVKARRLVLISTIAVLANSVGLDEDTDQFEVTKAYGRNRRFLETQIAEMFTCHHILRLPALFGAGLKKNFIFDILNPVPSFLTKVKFEKLDQELSEAARVILHSVYSFNHKINMFECERAELEGADNNLLCDALFACGFTALSFTNAESTFQYYHLDRLWADIEVVIKNDLNICHMAPEPLRADVIYKHLTGHSFVEGTAAPYHEDMRTKHSDCWARTGLYTQDAEAVLSALAAFHDKVSAL